MSKEQVCLAIKDAIYFIRKGESDKAIKILEAILKGIAGPSAAKTRVEEIP